MEIQIYLNNEDAQVLEELAHKSGQTITEMIQEDILAWVKDEKSVAKMRKELREMEIKYEMERQKIIDKYINM